MNQQVQQALKSFSTILSTRKSYLSDPDKSACLTKTQVVDKVNAAVLVPFEERCIATGKRKASWIFNRNDAKFHLNRIYKTGNPQFPKKR